MTEISKAAKLSKEYMNHSCRATTVHLLDEADIPDRHIMSVTGHKSATSLKTYAGKTGEKKKKHMSEIISGKTMEQPSNARGVMQPIDMIRNVDFLSLSQSSMIIQHDSGANFELQSLSGLQTEAVLGDIDMPDDGFNDILKVLEIPTETERNQQCVKMNKFPFGSFIPQPVLNNCQSVTINYNILPKN